MHNIAQTIALHLTESRLVSTHTLDTLLALFEETAAPNLGPAQKGQIISSPHEARPESGDPLNERTCGSCGQ
jgi:hypothetical protein